MNQYDILRVIGMGSTGEVYLAKARDSQTIYSIKKSKLKLDAIHRIVNNEIEMLQHINHPNVVSVIGHFEEHGFYYIILEYLPLGNLKQLLLYFQTNKEIIPESVIQHILFDCLSGLSAIHEKQIIHRDIKPENLLISSDGTIKICDFTASVKTNGFHNTCVGTIQYMAPELLKRDFVTPSADVWSLGCVIYELMCRQPLFPNMPIENKMIHFVEQWKGEVELPLVYSNELRDLVKEMLVVEPEKRPSIHSLLCRSYFQNLSGKSLTKLYAEISTIHSELDCLDIHVDKKESVCINKKIRDDSSFLVKNGQALLEIYKELKKV